MKDLLLENEHVVVLQPKLVEILGFAESVMLQQVHYWLNRSENIIDGVPWVYNTYENWKEHIKILSNSSIVRAIKKLEIMGILKTSNFNKSKFDKTKWYTIDYEKLQTVCGKEASIYPQRVKEETTESKPIPKNTTKNTTKKEKKENKKENQQVTKTYKENLNNKKQGGVNNGGFKGGNGKGYDNNRQVKEKKQGKWAGFKPPEPKRSANINDMEGIF